jgi:hypothetical protein
MDSHSCSSVSEKDFHKILVDTLKNLYEYDKTNESKTTGVSTIQLAKTINTHLYYAHPGTKFPDYTAQKLAAPLKEAFAKYGFRYPARDESWKTALGTKIKILPELRRTKNPAFVGMRQCETV